MKTFALSMLFSLAVILVEQQTLFAPHYSDWNGGKLTAVTKVQSAALPWHRGIPAPDEAMDLWFELVDAGFAEDEAFDLVEMVLENDLGTARRGPLQQTIRDPGTQVSGDATGKVTHLTKTKIKVQQEVGPTTPFLDIDAATVVVDRQGNPATVYKGDRVKVEFTGNHADKITIL